MPSVGELNKIIGRIREVQKKFGDGSTGSASMDNSFDGRVQRCKVSYF